MDTNHLINEAKARFSHNSAKAYLKDKYNSKLLLADQNGLWKITPELISYLSSLDDYTTILLDNYGNPVKVEVKMLLTKLIHTHKQVMTEWHDEWTELEKQR